MATAASCAIISCEHGGSGKAGSRIRLPATFLPVDNSLASLDLDELRCQCRMASRVLARIGQQDQVILGLLGILIVGQPGKVDV